MKNLKHTLLIAGAIMLGLAGVVGAQQAIGAYGKFRNQASVPATPPAGFTWIFTKQSDKLPYSIDDTGAVTAMSGGGGGSGTVTSVDCQTGLTCTPDPIVSSGTIALANTAVTPGSYTYMSGTVDAQGRLTAASSGAAPALAATTITAGTGMSGGGSLAANRTITLADTAVTPGSYTSTNITVDQQGRITAAANGSSGGGTFATTYSATPANNIVPVDSTGGKVTYNRTDVGTSQLDAIGVDNTTAATNGNQKFSPVVPLCGRQFETTGSTSQSLCWGLQAQPVQDTAGRGDFVLYTKVAAGAWSKFLSFVYDPVSTVHKFQANVAIFQILNSAGTGISPQSNDMYIYNAGAASLELTNGAALSPFTDGARTLGYDAKRWGAVRTWWVETKRGAQLTAAASITPTTGFHHVTGATTIDTIAATNVPTSGNATLTLAGDGGTITWSAAGNILSAGTLAQDKTQIFMYDATATKWIPQQ